MNPSSLQDTCPECGRKIIGGDSTAEVFVDPIETCKTCGKKVWGESET